MKYWIISVLGVTVATTGYAAPLQCHGPIADPMKDAHYEKSYVSARTSFKDKYLADAGDFKDAQMLFGPDAVNGNGDGVVDAKELTQVCSHLIYAKLIEL